MSLSWLKGLPQLHLRFVFIALNWTKPAKNETPHSFKGQQLENKLLYRFVIYMGFLEKYLSYNLTLSL